MRNGAGDLQRLGQVPLLSVHDHQQVHIAIFCRCTIGMRAKEDDFLGMKVIYNLLGYFFNCPFTDHLLSLFTSAPPCASRQPCARLPLDLYNVGWLRSMVPMQAASVYSRHRTLERL